MLDQQCEHREALESGHEAFVVALSSCKKLESKYLTKLQSFKDFHLVKKS